eukprot:UN04691
MYAFTDWFKVKCEKLRKIFKIDFLMTASNLNQCKIISQSFCVFTKSFISIVLILFERLQNIFNRRRNFTFHVFNCQFQ